MPLVDQNGKEQLFNHIELNYTMIKATARQQIWLGPSKHSPMEGLDALQAAIEKGHEEVEPFDS